MSSILIFFLVGCNQEVRKGAVDTEILNSDFKGKLKLYQTTDLLERTNFRACSKFNNCDFIKYAIITEALREIPA
ncbi:hypothetical protein G9A89_016491 [Geosiphon pyriformis]|nr:hypothetical protein G9A89_016491 [Geosiphon pyriformis]